MRFLSYVLFWCKLSKCTEIQHYAKSRNIAKYNTCLSWTRLYFPDSTTGYFWKTGSCNRQHKTSDDLCCHQMTPRWPSGPYRLSLPQTKQLHFMEIVNIEAGNIYPTAERKIGKPQRQENLKESGWLDGQSGSVHDTEHIAENTAGPEKQRYLTLLPDWPENLLSETGCYQTDWKSEEEIIPVKARPIHTSKQLFIM